MKLYPVQLQKYDWGRIIEVLKFNHKNSTDRKIKYHMENLITEIESQVATPLPFIPKITQQ